MLVVPSNSLRIAGIVLYVFIISLEFHIGCFRAGRTTVLYTLITHAFVMKMAILRKTRSCFSKCSFRYCHQIAVVFYLTSLRI